MRSRPFCEANLFEKLWRNPFQSLGQRPILTCACKGGQRNGATDQTENTANRCTTRHRAATLALPRAASLRYSFLEGAYGRCNRLCAVRDAGGTLRLREVLHHLQRAAQHPSLFGRALLLSRLPGSLRRWAG